MARDTLTEVHQVTFVVVTRGNLYPLSFSFTVVNSAELEEAVMKVKRDAQRDDIVHTTVLFDKREPFVMRPGRGSPQLQALYIELRG